MTWSQHSCNAIGCRVVPCVVMAVSAIVGPVHMASAGFLTEKHEFRAEYANPTWDTTYTGTFDVPKFDTMGGSRTLIGITLDYWGPELDYTYTVHNNPTAEAVGAQARWEKTFGLSDSSGSLLFPLEQDPHVLSGARSRTVIVPAFFDQGYTNVVTYNLDEPDYSEVTGDPGILAAMTGGGLLSLDYELTLGELVYSDPTFPPDLPPHIFDPSILDITPDLYHAGLDVSYHYTSVPAPGALTLLGLAGATTRRRRRR